MNTLETNEKTNSQRENTKMIQMENIELKNTITRIKKSQDRFIESDIGNNEFKNK